MGESSSQDTQTKVLEKTAIKKPPLYRVILHNDDYTTMDFVIEVLERIFHHSFQDAERIMLDVHLKGKGVVGVYPKDIAATKVRQVHLMARERGFPLKASYERV